MLENMLPYSLTYSPHKKRHRVDSDRRIDSSAVVTAFMRELRWQQGKLRSLDIKYKEDADYIRDFMNNPFMASEFGSLLNIQSQHQNWQSFEYIQSNLGRGYMFYFICSSCDSRVKFLYKPDPESPYWCRKCHGLEYPKGFSNQVN